MKKDRFIRHISRATARAFPLLTSRSASITSRPIRTFRAIPDKHLKTVGLSRDGQMGSFCLVVAVKEETDGSFMHDVTCRKGGGLPHQSPSQNVIEAFDMVAWAAPRALPELL